MADKSVDKCNVALANLMKRITKSIYLRLKIMCKLQSHVHSEVNRKIINKEYEQDKHKMDFHLK